MTEAKFTIGHMLAAGVHIETVRYYQFMQGNRRHLPQTMDRTRPV